MSGRGDEAVDALQQRLVALEMQVRGMTTGIETMISHAAGEFERQRQDLQVLTLNAAKEFEKQGADTRLVAGETKKEFDAQRVNMQEVMQSTANDLQRIVVGVKARSKDSNRRWRAPNNRPRLSSRTKGWHWCS